MQYHLNRAMFYHQLLSEIETEVNKADPIGSSKSNKQETNTSAISHEDKTSSTATERASKTKHIEAM